jgi:hypothetical protein
MRSKEIFLNKSKECCYLINENFFMQEREESTKFEQSKIG